MRMFARVVIILDLLDALRRRILDKRIEYDRGLAQIVEERIHPLVEERQPMLHAVEAPAFADSLIKGVAARLPAKARSVRLPETAHRLARQPQFAHRRQVERTELPRGALRIGIERADRFERFAKEIETDRGRQPRRIKIDNAAALRIFAGLAHRAGAQIAVRLEPKRQLVELHDIAGRGGEAFRGDHPLRRNALQQAIDGGRDDARTFE